MSILYLFQVIARSLSWVADFNEPHLHLSPPRGWSRSNFAVNFGVRKLELGLSCGIIYVILCLAILIQYRSVADIYRHTTKAYTALSIASRGKNAPKYTDLNAVLNFLWQSLQNTILGRARLCWEGVQPPFIGKGRRRSSTHSIVLSSPPYNCPCVEEVLHPFPVYGRGCWASIDTLDNVKCTKICRFEHRILKIFDRVFWPPYWEGCPYIGKGHMSPSTHSIPITS